MDVTIEPDNAEVSNGYDREYNMTGTTLLVVEDEPEILEMLGFTLERAGYSIISAASAEDALRQIEHGLPALILIDWMLPGMSGIELARRLRRDELTADVPLVMLTARGEETDKLKSFETGIDDYITKPFSPRELVARVKALLRRSGTPPDGIIEASGIKIDTQGHRVLIDDQVVRMGPTEYRLLEFLVRHPNRAFDRTQLLDRVWGRSVYVEDRTVDVHVLRLRKTLKPYAKDELIQTVRGVGYRFAPAGGQG
jgi:two-component system, OmpR family, phosphate regulon response regulator PhoB